MQPNLFDQLKEIKDRLSSLERHISIDGSQITDDSITTSKLANGLITTTKLYDDAVTADKIADTGWVAVTLQNSWVNYDTTYGVTNLTYIRKISNMVFMRGLVKSGTIGQTIFTLPTGYRPSINLIFSTTSMSAYAELRVNANGTVVPTSGNNGWYSIACSFIAEQ